MKAIHLKLPNEKQNEASSTRRGFCEREGERDGWWPIISSVISILVDGFPFWVSCTRASGCPQSNMIYSWLLGWSPHTHIHVYQHRHTDLLTRKETESKTQQCVTHMPDYQQTRTQPYQTETLRRPTPRFAPVKQHALALTPSAAAAIPAQDASSHGS